MDARARGTRLFALFFYSYLGLLALSFLGAELLLLPENPSIAGVFLIGLLIQCIGGNRILLSSALSRRLVLPYGPRAYLLFLLGIFICWVSWLWILRVDWRWQVLVVCILPEIALIILSLIRGRRYFQPWRPFSRPRAFPQERASRQGIGEPERIVRHRTTRETIVLFGARYLSTLSWISIGSVFSLWLVRLVEVPRPVALATAAACMPPLSMRVVNSLPSPLLTSGCHAMRELISRRFCLPSFAFVGDGSGGARGEPDQVGQTMHSSRRRR
jgi:hypothetical protein